MTDQAASIAVLGNVTLDIICKTVDDVPRHDSIAFEEFALTPGGCASNTAIGLAQTGYSVYLAACTGGDQTAELLFSSWKSVGVKVDFVQQFPELQTGLSIGLVDSDQQPRFIYSPGANSQLDQDILNKDSFLKAGIRFLHTAGYFVLPGLLDPAFGIALKEIQDAGIFTSLDVVRSPAMKSPDPLWEVLPYLDLFTCNQGEARILSGCQEPDEAAAFFHRQGARRVIIKLGAEGCWLSDGTITERIPAPGVTEVLDTTGAGDAFAAGLLAALQEGQDLVSACQAGNQKGAQATQFLGAVKLDSSRE